MAERAKWFRNLERQHQQTVSFLHAAQRGEIEIDGMSGKKINSAIRWERKQLRWARNTAIYSGDIQPYPKVEQMKKTDRKFAPERTNGHANGHSNGNGHQITEDLKQYISAASARILAASIS